MKTNAMKFECYNTIYNKADNAVVGDSLKGTLKEIPKGNPIKNTILCIICLEFCPTDIWHKQ